MNPRRIPSPGEISSLMRKFHVNGVIAQRVCRADRLKSPAKTLLQSDDFANGRTQRHQGWNSRNRGALTRKVRALRPVRQCGT